MHSFHDLSYTCCLAWLVKANWAISIVLQARKMQESGWKPRWFAKDKATDTYRYVGGYWESREKSSWEGCPDIFGQVPNDLMVTD
jgi:hypothetical protein